MAFGSGGIVLTRGMSSPDKKPGSSPESHASTNPPNWDAIAQDRDFRVLLLDKAKFVVPATAFFVVYYFALPVLVGFAPEFMRREVIGPVNIAYLFALSQFFMAWIIAGLYVKVARRWDREAAAVLKKYDRK